MPAYRSLGQIPPKRHTQFRRPDGSLFTEELFGTAGFSGCSSLLYHHYLPTAVSEVRRIGDVAPRPWHQELYHHHHLRSRVIPASGDPVSARRYLLFNTDVAIAVARPLEQMDYFYRNGEADELWFVHHGRGVLHSSFGSLAYRERDYLVIPRGVTYRLECQLAESRFYIVEAKGPIETPRRYRNEFGQLLEHAPFCERDIRGPAALETHEELGEFEVRVKINDRLMAYQLDHHPFDVIGWDGYVYPWALNASDFEPITGRVHQPPPVHQTFQGPHFVVCTFVPRKLDYHPEAVPVPYNHSNVDYDEVLYYASETFLSRRGIEEGSLTIHPRGLPHGPQPGVVEAALGKEFTDEMAVMLDSYHPLALASGAASLDDPHYWRSWTMRSE